MKNLFKYTFAAILASVLFAACSSQRTATTPTVSRNDVSGKWMVSNVTLEGFPPSYSVGRVFDMANYQDFQGSTWDLNGNYTGSITLSNGTTQEIYWSINKDNAYSTFQFKKLEDGQKPKNVVNGYRLQFGDIANGTAVFKTPVPLAGGQMGYINFTFTKA